MSVVTFEITGNSTVSFNSSFRLTTKKLTKKNIIIFPCEGNVASVDSSHKGPVVRKLFPFRYVIPYAIRIVHYHKGTGWPDSRFAPSKWETSLQTNAISHWLGANLESALIVSLSTAASHHVVTHVTPAVAPPRVTWDSARQPCNGVRYPRGANGSEDVTDWSENGLVQFQHIYQNYKCFL